MSPRHKLGTRRRPEGVSLYQWFVSPRGRDPAPRGLGVRAHHKPDSWMRRTAAEWRSNLTAWFIPTALQDSQHSATAHSITIRF